VYLNHVTLTSGHVRRSSREEVSDNLLAQLRPVVAECERAGEAEFPSPSGLMILRRIVESERPSRHVAVWAISEPQGPALVTIALAMQARAGAGLWRQLHAIPALATRADDLPPAPWLAALLHLPACLPEPHPAVHWLGDCERCIAWAWIDEVYRRD